MSIAQVVQDNKTLWFPFPASQAVSKGDLLYWDATNKLAKPLTLLATGASEANDQATVAGSFLGVAQDVRLSTETDANAPRVAITEGIFDADCVSFSPKVGDFVGATWNGGSALVNQVVKQVPNLFLAIGMVVAIPRQADFTAQWGSAQTKVRVRLFSRLAWDLLTKAQDMGGMQGTGATALTDAAQVLTVGSNPILSMVPTAARNVTLPLESVSAGLMFYFTNNSGGAFSVTFLASGGGSIKGNGVVPQNKTGVFWCDGTNWNGSVSA